MSSRQGNRNQRRKRPGRHSSPGPDRAGREAPRTPVSRRRARSRAQRPGTLFEKLVALQALLRSPRGCPWDREQTHDSLRTYLLEETYEVLDALDSGEGAKLAAELGDLLLQIVFHAQLAREAGHFDIADVIEHIHTKMVRRHPHVFGKLKAKTAAQVLKSWEQIKSDERRQEAADAAAAPGAASLLDGVPKTLPALLEAFQLTRRAARVGFDWDDMEGLFEKLKEETGELREVLGLPDRSRLEEEAGDLLFVAANMARFLNVDPEIALKKANRKFIGRFKEMERQAGQSGRRLAEVARDDLEALWEASKQRSQPPASREQARADEAGASGARPRAAGRRK